MIQAALFPPRRRSPWFIFGLYLLAALGLTYPLVFNLTGHIPLGSEPAATVPFFNLWTLQWNVKQLVQGYPHYWQAPIFAPHAGTFAFSENQLLSGLLIVPVWLGSQSPALAYNGLVLLFLTLNGWFGYWLLRGWLVEHRPALLAGFLIQALPFIAQEMGVIQLTALFGFLWSLLFLSRFLRSPKQVLDSAGIGSQRFHTPSSWRTNIALALGLPVTFFTCSYYGLFSLLFLPPAFLLQIRRDRLHWAGLGRLCLVGLLAGLLTLPLLWVQQQHLAAYGFTRSETTIQNNSARPGDYLRFLDDNLWYGQILNLDPGQGQRLFPGAGLIFLAGFGLFGGGAGRVKFYLGLAIILAFLLSLGLGLNLAGFQPYQWLREGVPGLAQLRSPFRFAVFVQLHLALLAGFGLANLDRRLPAQGQWLPPLLAAATIFEALAWPLPLQATPSFQQAAWQQWLNQQDQPVRVVMLPFAAGNSAASFEPTTRWMLNNSHLQGDMVNGYSGFFPPDHAQLRRLMLALPTPEGLAFLRERGVGYVVVDHRWPNAPPEELLRAALPLIYRDQDGQVIIYLVRELARG